MFLVVNNAGYVLGVERVGAISEADIEGMFSTNVFGLIAMTQLLIKGLITDSGSFASLPNPIPICRFQGA